MNEHQSEGSAAAVLDPPVKAPRERAKKAAVVTEKEHRKATGDQPFRPPRAPDSLSGITDRICGPDSNDPYTRNKWFDWARDSRHHHYSFTRFYIRQLVLVDVWGSVNPSALRESEKKRACVDAENKRRVKMKLCPIGYLSVVRGAVVREESFVAVLEGKTLPLLSPAAKGVLT